MRTCTEECLKYLTYSRTEKEVRDHLYKLEYKFEEIENAIIYAKELNYIDDDDYANSYVNDHLLINKWGPIKIKLKLLEKGIDSNLIDNAILDNEEIIYRNIEEHANKKYTKDDLTDYNIKNKAIRHLLNKGYNYDMIKEVLDKNE